MRTIYADKNKLALLKEVKILSGGHQPENLKEQLSEEPAQPNMCVMEAISWIMNDQSYSPNNLAWVNDSPVCVLHHLTESMIGLNDSFDEIEFRLGDDDCYEAAWLYNDDGLVDQARTRLLTPLIPMLIGTAFTEMVGNHVVQLEEQFLTTDEWNIVNRIRFIANDFSQAMDAAVDDDIRSSYEDAVTVFNTFVDETRDELLHLVTEFTNLRKPHMEIVYSDTEHEIHEHDLIRFSPDTEKEAEATEQLVSDFINAFATEKVTEYA